MNDNDGNVTTSSSTTTTVANTDVLEEDNTDVLEEYVAEQNGEFAKACGEYGLLIDRILRGGSGSNDGEGQPQTFADFTAAVDGYLVTCDEIRASSAAISTEVKRTTDVLIPKIESNMRQLEALFQIINSLDLITQGIESSALKMELRVKSVKKAYDERHPKQLKKFFSSLNFLRSSSDVHHGEPPPMPPWKEVDFITDTGPLYSKLRQQYWHYQSAKFLGLRAARDQDAVRDWFEKLE